jgi:hypothetical protein
MYAEKYRSYMDQIIRNAIKGQRSSDKIGGQTFTED